MTGGLGTGIIHSMVDNHLTDTTSDIIQVEEFPLVYLLISSVMPNLRSGSFDPAYR